MHDQRRAEIKYSNASGARRHAQAAGIDDPVGDDRKNCQYCR